MQTLHASRCASVQPRTRTRSQTAVAARVLASCPYRRPHIGHLPRADTPHNCSCPTRGLRRVVSVYAAASEYKVVPAAAQDGRQLLKVTVPASVCTASLEVTVERLQKEVVGKVPGFREGKIPLYMVIERVGGQRNFKAAVLEEVLHRSMPEVMGQHALRPVPGSEKIDTALDTMLAKFDPARALTYQVSYESMPQLVWRKPYRELSVSIRDNGSLEDDASAADDLILQFRKDKGTQRVVVGRGLAQGDVAIVKMAVRTADGRVPLPGLQKDKFNMDTNVDPLGLHTHMLGMTTGDTRKFTFTFPDDWHVDLWQGMPAEAEITLLELLAWELPEFNDKFVAKHFPHHESAEKMREHAMASSTLERMKHLTQTLQDALVKEIEDNTEAAVPEAMLYELGSTQFRSSLMSMLQKGVARPADLERLATPEMLDEFIANKRAELEGQFRFLLAVEDIFAGEGLALDQEVLQAQLDASIKQCQVDKVEYDEELLRQQCEEQLKVATVVEWLQTNANVHVDKWEPPAAQARSPPTAAAAAAT